MNVHQLDYSISLASESERWGGVPATESLSRCRCRAFETGVGAPLQSRLW